MITRTKMQRDVSPSKSLLPLLQPSMPETRWPELQSFWSPQRMLHQAEGQRVNDWRRFHAVYSYADVL